MKTISLKIDDTIFEDTENIIAITRQSRNRYINEAIAHYNKLHNRKMLAEQLKKESRSVGKESMAVLKEFESIEFHD